MNKNNLTKYHMNIINSIDKIVTVSMIYSERKLVTLTHNTPNQRSFNIVLRSLLY